MAGAKSEKSNTVAILLCFFLGALIDFIMIVLGKFTDKEGNVLQWN